MNTMSTRLKTKNKSIQSFKKFVTNMLKGSRTQNLNGSWEKLIKIGIQDFHLSITKNVGPKQMVK